MDTQASTATKLTDAQRLDWLRLIRSDNVGPRTFRSLVNHFGGARAALDHLPELAKRGGAQRSGRICTHDEAEREIEAARKLGAVLLAPGEHGYPPYLAEIDDAPPLLAVRGELQTAMRPIIGIVGSRNASGVGLKFAATLAHDLADAGYVIASGLARGIDAAAHRVTVQSGTIAVLAGGHDKIYPPENESLLVDIVAEGAAISEMPMGHAPRARDFPRRNRLISGVSLGVVIVEAAHRSGSLITARFANEQGRQVFAVPGSPLDPRAAGANDLIKQGAALVTQASDVIDAVQPMLARPMSLPASENDNNETYDDWPDDLHVAQRAAVVSLLGPSPIGIDDLVRMSGASPASVRMILLELDLAGRLERHGGNQVSLL